MESERKWIVDVLGGEQEENEGVLSEGSEELDFFIADDDEVNEEEQGSAPLLEACRKNVTEVNACCSCCVKVELVILRACEQMVALLLMARADVTQCDHNRRTALLECPPELREKVVSWMSRPDLPPQAELLQAAWQRDVHSVQTLLV